MDLVRLSRTSKYEAIIPPLSYSKSMAHKIRPRRILLRPRIFDNGFQHPKPKSRRTRTSGVYCCNRQGKNTMTYYTMMWSFANPTLFHAKKIPCTVKTSESDLPPTSQPTPPMHPRTYRRMMIPTYQDTAVPAYNEGVEWRAKYFVVGGMTTHTHNETRMADLQRLFISIVVSRQNSRQQKLPVRTRFGDAQRCEV